jgi:hypothetical protein
VAVPVEPENAPAGTFEPEKGTKITVTSPKGDETVLVDASPLTAELRIDLSASRSEAGLTDFDGSIRQSNAIRPVQPTEESKKTKRIRLKGNFFTGLAAVGAAVLVVGGPAGSVAAAGIVNRTRKRWDDVLQESQR